jgi:hypothetical protein
MMMFYRAESRKLTLVEIVAPRHVPDWAHWAAAMPWLVASLIKEQKACCLSSQCHSKKRPLTCWGFPTGR